MLIRLCLDSLFNLADSLLNFSGILFSSAISFKVGVLSSGVLAEIRARSTARQTFIEAQCEFRSSRADVVEFVADRALQNNAEPKRSIAWPQRIQSKKVILTRFQ
jgi:hypothetical protein